MNWDGLPSVGIVGQGRDGRRSESSINANGLGFKQQLLTVCGWSCWLTVDDAEWAARATGRLPVPKTSRKELRKHLYILISSCSYWCCVETGTDMVNSNGSCTFLAVYAGRADRVHCSSWPTRRWIYACVEFDKKRSAEGICCKNGRANNQGRVVDQIERSREHEERIQSEYRKRRHCLKSGTDCHCRY